ncbi:hypothetical protein CDAR_65141 [Caerostris darwini]|uniref:Uncharacterized protein n=1 Tax=Caerostris darwini TaxID=1538125 RepID=A0AAV4VSH9_9ARAC|nr:hypothetical protein CDAR_65141 [Caerostris darwini]
MKFLHAFLLLSLLAGILTISLAESEPGQDAVSDSNIEERINLWGSEKDLLKSSTNSTLKSAVLKSVSLEVHERCRMDSHINIYVAIFRIKYPLSKCSLNCFLIINE